MTQLIKLTLGGCNGDYCGEMNNAWAIATTCLFSECALTFFHWVQDTPISGLMSRVIELIGVVSQISFILMFLWGIDGGSVDTIIVWICAIMLVIVFVTGGVLRSKGAKASA